MLPKKRSIAEIMIRDLKALLDLLNIAKASETKGHE